MRNNNGLTNGIIVLAVNMSLGLVANCSDSGSGLDNDSGTNDASTIPVDNDGDGHLSNVDCDDNDPAVFAGISRECSSDCDDGWELCLASGSWTECNARTDCTCEHPGDTRVVSCGRCGSSEVTCGLDNAWSYPTNCQGEGVCTPGTQEEAACDTCGTRTRLCSSECAWLSWDETACYGECAPGASEITSDDCSETWEQQERQCSSDCAWETLVPCTADCWLSARTGTSDFKDEICVPSGPFLMGADPFETGSSCDEPEHTVILSPYFIDVYEVTVTRYRECVDAGVCVAPVSAGSTYYVAGFEDYPVTYIRWEDASTFCAWDGRRLPTEAEWEKAARGPAPEDVPYPWGTAPATCEHLPALECPTYTYIAPVDAHSAGASHYGLYQMGGNAPEWVNDWYECDYYATSPQVDPPGPSSSSQGYRIIRGRRYNNLVQTENSIIKRTNTTPSGFYSDIGFRCAKDGS